MSENDIAKLKQLALSNPNFMQRASRADKENAIKILNYLGIQY